MSKLVVDFDSEEMRTAIRIAIKEQVQAITSQEVEKLIEQVIEKKFHRVDDAKIEGVLKSAIETKIMNYFEGQRWSNSPTEFAKVVERVLREMIEVKKK